MSNTTIHGGPAFPMASVTVLAEDMSHTSLTHHGMTLRDYFAAKAMQALVSNDALHELWNDWERGNEPGSEDSICHPYATLAYGIAGAMLERRNYEAQNTPAEKPNDQLLKALQKIAGGQEMNGEFTHLETVLRYQEIARAAIITAGEQP